ncbi:MAG: hypothetical protein NC121_00730 [Blautia sp.]|nr:hypothetical protein [Blautia sp.]
MENEKSADSYPFLKSTYYMGKLLRATDLTREQDYGNSKREFMNRKFCGWGIIEGLEVRAGRGGKLFLSRGSAIDPQGRILVVSEDRVVKPDEIGGLQPEAGQDLVLGICYDERTLEMEREYLKNGESYQPSVIAETYALHTFEMSKYHELKKEALHRESVLTEEKTLYENGAVKLTVRIPKVVPADSLFRIRIQVRTAGESDSSIGWRGMLKLQGAVFAHSGENGCMLEEEPAMCSGSLQREWDICTEENRTLPVMLEISRLEILTGNAETSEISACQFQIETTSSYDRTVKRYLRDLPGQDQGGNWVPLACLRRKEAGGHIFLIKDEHLRIYVNRPCEEAALRGIAEENGILDIRWRKLLKHIWRFPISPAPVPPPPMPPAPRLPEPGPPMPPPFQPPEDLLTEQRFRELMDADRKSRINRGIIVIPVPSRYRKGQVLLSEEVSHGFPGEEVFLRCSRVWEEVSYAYWERDRKRYRITQGDESLFPDVCNGQEILRQAVLQNVEAGTFQVALTLKKRCRRKRSREVAISWTAVRSV